MGKISEKVINIYDSQEALTEKIIQLLYYSRKVGINSHNFEILLDEVKKHKWDKEGGENYGRGYLSS